MRVLGAETGQGWPLGLNDSTVERGRVDTRSAWPLRVEAAHKLGEGLVVGVYHQAPAGGAKGARLDVSFASIRIANRFPQPASLVSAPASDRHATTWLA